MRGATPINPFPKSLYNVSIHAPHAGRDASSPTPCGSFSGFNPRAPCGARLSYAEKISPAYGWFQSTRPMRGATSPHTSSKSCIGCFNPRAPCGARPFVKTSTAVRHVFQSTRPMRGATVRVTHLSATASFNPRAPCGARHTCMLQMAPRRCFNPRAPCGARPAPLRRGFLLVCFNPRAPCGARPLSRSSSVLQRQFQSTRPMRGATKS